MARTGDLVACAWAAPLLAGMRVVVLEAGLARGARLLLERGALEVVALSGAGAVLDAARAAPREGLVLLAGTPQEIPLPAQAADAVLWAAAPRDPVALEIALSEVRRVVRSGGLVVLGIALDPGSNGARPALALLRERFACVEVAVERSAMAAVAGALDAGGSAVTRVGPELPPARMLVAASDEPFPAPATAITVAGVAEFHSWESAVADRDAVIAGLRDEVRLLRDAQAERSELQRMLEDSEAELAAVPDLRETIAQLRHEVRVLCTRMERADRVMRELQGSPSWRVTTPLRAVKRLRK